MRVPECEILMPTNAVKNFIRNRDFFKIISAMETGAEQGLWTFARYCAWLEKRTNWYIPEQNPEPPDSEMDDAAASAGLPPLAPPRTAVAERKSKATKPGAGTGARIEIEPTEGDFGKILK